MKVFSILFLLLFVVLVTQFKYEESSFTPFKVQSSTSRKKIPKRNISSDEKNKDEKIVNESVDHLTDKIKQLKSCFDIHCDHYHEKDPKAYYFNLSLEMTKLIGELANKNKNQGLTDLEIKLLEDLIPIESGHIRSSIIEIFRTLPPSYKRKQLLINHGLESFDAKVSYQSLTELLLKYPFDHQVKDSIKHFLLTGPLFSKRKFAKNLNQFITAQNFDFFKSISKNFPKNSRLRSYFYQALNDFQKSKNGA